ncbi:MAG: hypothetical protein SGPRY_008756 [Prymnesium sp.]
MRLLLLLVATSVGWLLLLSAFTPQQAPRPPVSTRQPAARPHTIASEPAGRASSTQGQEAAQLLITRREEAAQPFKSSHGERQDASQRFVGSIEREAVPSSPFAQGSSIRRSNKQTLVKELRAIDQHDKEAEVTSDASETTVLAEHESRQTCYSFNRKLCPPLNLSIQSADELRHTQQQCHEFVRLRRRNPCWREQGITSCLPRFFILGEMKCGTTSLYRLLDKHPQIVPPLTKEPRFLIRGRYEGTTLSRYAINFRPVVSTEEAITFDASPVYLRSRIARDWISRWLPDAKLIVLVRNPVQRSYSHWKMGREWLSSQCSGPKEAAALERWKGQLEFDSMMERGLMRSHLKRCLSKAGSKQYVGAGLDFIEYRFNEGEEELHDRMKRCLFAKDAELTSKFETELAGLVPSEMREELKRVRRLVDKCSESMLSPESALNKGLSYAPELRQWARLFSPEQLKVIHTDDLASSAQRILNSTFKFLGLDPVDVGTDSRFCVHGKAGVLDQTDPEFRRSM